MKSMPYSLKQKLRRYNNAVKKVHAIHREIAEELEKYGVPYENLCAEADPYGEEPHTEALAFISNGEGDIEENISKIEEVFFYFAKNQSR